MLNLIQKISLFFIASLTLVACGERDTDPRDIGNNDTGVFSDSDGVEKDTSYKADDPGSTMSREEVKKKVCSECEARGKNCPDDMSDQMKDQYQSPDIQALADKYCPKKGVLKIKANTTAKNPKIILDGEDTGKTAPAEFQVGGGKHRVLLKKNGYLMHKRKAQEVWVSEDTEVEVPLYRDASGTWRDESKPSRKYNVKMHFDSFRNTSEECEDDVYLQGLNDRTGETSYCIHSDDTFTLCSKNDPCQGYWYKGRFLSADKIRFTGCSTNSGCFQPWIFKKISD